VDVLEPEGSRPEPPAYLSPYEAEEWREIVSMKPAGYFDRGTWGLLINHCRHVANQRWHMEEAARIRNEAEDGQGIDIKMLAFHEKQAAEAGAALNSVDTKLRLTPHSRDSHRKANAAPQGRPPWTA
jgi:hypothetical protein